MASSGVVNSVVSDRAECPSYILVDIGANLTNRKFSRDLDSVLKRAEQSGVQKIMVTGTSVENSKEALRLTRIYPGTLYSTAGVHPHEAISWTDDSEAELRTLLSAENRECVALGECGLDFNRNFSPPHTQIQVFEKQVALACELQRPLFVHEREAHEETVRLLRAAGPRLPPTVIHCFTGTEQHVRTYLSMGLYIGLTGYVWKDKSDCSVRHILKQGIIPLDRLLLETDAPYMFPSMRGSRLPAEIQSRLANSPTMQYVQRYCSFQRNEPCSLAATAELIAALSQCSVYDIAMSSTHNAVKLFALSS